MSIVRHYKTFADVFITSAFAHIRRMKRQMPAGASIAYKKWHITLLLRNTIIFSVFQFYQAFLHCLDGQITKLHSKYNIIASTCTTTDEFQEKTNFISLRRSIVAIRLSWPARENSCRKVTQIEKLNFVGGYSVDDPNRVMMYGPTYGPFILQVAWVHLSKKLKTRTYIYTIRYGYCLTCACVISRLPIFMQLHIFESAI